MVPSESDLLSERLWRAVAGPSQLIFLKPLSQSILKDSAVIFIHAVSVDGCTFHPS